MRKVVIVSLATYPSQTPRSFRTHELAVELARQGHDVTLYVLPGKYNYDKYELENNLKVKSLGRTYFFKYDHKIGIYQNLFFKIIKKLFANLLEFPLIELARNSYKTLKKEKNVDLLITIGRPYPIHWGIALYKTLHDSQSKSNPKIWVADCGDPYMGNKFHKKPFYFSYLEKWFCKKADYISIPISDAINGYYSEFHNKIKIIPQGFNFSDVKSDGFFKKNKVPTFIFAGSLYQKLRDPRPFLDYLLQKELEFKFIIYTKDKYLLNDYIHLFGGKLIVLDYIQRKDLIQEMRKADFLINFENPSSVQSPSKLIDYAISGRPILSVNTNTFLDVTTISDFLDGNYTNKFVISDIEQYNIKNVAEKFINLL